MTRIKKNTGLLFGEGKKETTFFKFLLGSHKFKSLEDKWFIKTDHASGSSCEDVLNKCISVISERSYEVVLCFIDTDKLHFDYPTTHQEKRDELEQKASENGIDIVWQDANQEDVMREASGGKIKDKGGFKRRLRLHEQVVLSSDFVKDIYNRFFHFPS